jgi:3-hydroxybutyryl-CoA dehydratase
VELGAIRLGEEFVRDYLQAVGDRSPVYIDHGLVPPVALMARALGPVLDHLDLPPGAVHSVQEIHALGPVSFGQEVTGTVDLASPRRRGGMEFITAAISLRDSDGEETTTGKSTVIVQDPSGDAPKSPGEDRGPRPVREAPGRGNVTGDAQGLAPVMRTITHDQLRAYARVSGDHNPLHLDAEFAAATRFGGIIAHGMLTLAFVSEMMTAAFGRAWLESGVTKVRFKGAAYPGRDVLADGAVAREEPSPEGRRITCTVGVKNREDGLELVGGTAELWV